MKKNFLLFKILKIKQQKLQNFGALGMTPYKPTFCRYTRKANGL